MPNPIKLITLEMLTRFFGKFHKVAKTGSFNDLEDVPEGFEDTTYTFSEGDANGQIKVTPSSGSAVNVDVKGLGSAAFSNVQNGYSAQGTAPVNGKAITAALETLDVETVGGNGKYIKSIYESDGKIVAAAEDLNATAVGLGNVGNFKAVSTVASQSLSSTEQANARANIGAGTSSFDGNYSSLSGTPTLGTAAAKDSTNSVTENSTALVESGAVKEAIDSALSSAYKPAGDKAVSDLTATLLVKANLGKVYNITDTGVTTSNFVGDTGKPIRKGDNVAVVNTGTDESPVYKFDLLAGFVDTSNFVQKSNTAGLLKNDGTVDTSTYLTSHQSISGKADKVSNPTSGNFASLDANGNLADSGKKAADFATASHNQASSTINAMTGYEKPSSTSAISASDTLNAAIGKLEKGLEGKGTSNLTIGTSATTAAAGNHTHSGYASSSHSHASSDVTAMTSYSKPSSTSAIAATDSLNDAIGKLEKALDGKGTSNLSIGTTATTAAAGNHTHTASDVGLGNVGNFKAVSTVASQGLSTTEKSNARANIGAGTSNLAINDSTKSTTSVYSSTKTEEVISTMIGEAFSPESVQSNVINDNQKSANSTYSSNKIEELFGYVGITFGGCTDAELVDAIAKADAGSFTPANYWAVGDERSVSLSAMSATTGVDETQQAQTVTMVILHAGLYKDKNNKTVNFVVGLKEALKTSGKMNTTNTNAGSWDSCPRRAWCNSSFYNAIPSSIRSIFKQFKTVTAKEQNSSELTTSLDYFALLAEQEVFGAKTYATDAESAALTQLDYYKVTANRIKYTNGTTTAVYWFLRSPFAGGTASVCIAGTNGTASNGNANAASGIAPFGCI